MIVVWALSWREMSAFRHGEWPTRHESTISWWVDVRVYHGYRFVEAQVPERRVADRWLLDHFFMGIALTCDNCFSARWMVDASWIDNQEVSRRKSLWWISICRTSGHPVRGVAWISGLTTGKICRWRRGAFDGCRRVMKRWCIASSSVCKLSKFCGLTAL